MSLNEQQIEEAKYLDRGRTNIVFFAEKILGLTLNPGQRRFLRLFQVNEDGWSWFLKDMVEVAGNQVGKTVNLAIIVLWACEYKIGINNSDPMAWFRSPYEWFHIAPELNQAKLVLKNIRWILDSVHPAQEKFGGKCRLPRSHVDPNATLEGYYEGIAFWNGAVCHFRSTVEKAAGLQGRVAAGISFDECAYENYLIHVIDNVLYSRLVSTGGPLILVSTPNGINDFYEIVSAMQERVEVTDDDKLWVNESYREGLAWATIQDNVGYGITQEEYLRAEARDTSVKEQVLRGAFLASQDAFFVPQDKIMAAFNSKLPHKQAPRGGHSYAIFVDPSVEADPTAVVVLDITQKPWTGVYYDWQQQPRGIDSLIPAIVGLHTLYGSAQDRLGRTVKSTATTGYDATGMGGQIIRQHLSRIQPQMPVNFGGSAKIKANAFGDLRTALLMKELQLPGSWTRMKREIQNYKLEDKNLEQDSVFALAGATLVASSGMQVGKPVPFRIHARKR